MTNLSQMLTKTWLEMEQNSSSTTYNRERMVWLINEVWKSFIRGKTYNHTTDKHIELNIIPNNVEKICYQTLSQRVLVTEIDKTSTEIEFDTTDLEDSGAIYIDWEVIQYTSKQIDKILWVTWILSKHIVGSKIEIIFAIPTDLFKPITINWLFAWRNFEIKIKDPINPMATYYDLLLKNKKQFFRFYWLTIWTKVYVNYIKDYVNLVADLDESPFSDDVSLNIIPFIAGWNAIKDEVLRVKLLRQWFGKAIDESTSNWERNWKPQIINRKRFGFNTVN